MVVTAGAVPDAVADAVGVGVAQPGPDEVGEGEASALVTSAGEATPEYASPSTMSTVASARVSATSTEPGT